MWGIVPSIGVASSLSKTGVSRDLQPLGKGRVLGDYLVDRLVVAGANKLCFVVRADELDIVAHHGAEAGGRPTAYVVQPRPAGICDAVFRALPLVRPEDQVLVGLPGTVWFPEGALRRLGDGGLSFLCFPSVEPGRFEAVDASDDGEVRMVRADHPEPGERWIWAAFKLDGATLRSLHDLYRERGRVDARIGTLVSEWIARGGTARAVRAGEIFVDASTDGGLRDASRLVDQRSAH